MDAYERIRKYQSGELLPAHTGYTYLDKALLGGFYPQHAVAIGARPGVGKSYLAQKIMSNVMNVNINPQANDYVWLRCEFEMNPEDLMLRSLSKKMGKDIQDILILTRLCLEDSIPNMR
nr:MAG TPA: Helicase, ATPase, REPLICATION [Bacteriophage sp.]